MCPIAVLCGWGGVSAIYALEGDLVSWKVTDVLTTLKDQLAEPALDEGVPPLPHYYYLLTTTS